MFTRIIVIDQTSLNLAFALLVAYTAPDFFEANVSTFEQTHTGTNNERKFKFQLTHSNVDFFYFRSRLLYKFGLSLSCAISLTAYATPNSSTFG